MSTKIQMQKEWEVFKKSILESTHIDLSETFPEKKKRIEKLEANDEEWFKYYFPKFATHEPADFHKKATKRVMNNPEFYEVRNWSRELAKSTRTMMECLKLMLTGKKKYLLLTSDSESNAERLLAPYKANLEFNQRIINDYGEQKSFSNWTSGEFITKTQLGFRALGAGQSPRGSRNEQFRPDILLIDDFDTDVDCRNPETIDQKWKWLEEAFFGTRSISTPTLIVFCGNIIAEDCCITRAAKLCDHQSIINIRDNKGKSTWPNKNTEEFIDRVLSKISYSAQQKEYFNNPVTQGKTFKELEYNKIPSLKKAPFAVIYADPSYSNKDKPTVKSGAQNSTKAISLMTCINNTYYVHKIRVDHMSNAQFIESLYNMYQLASSEVITYVYIENNSLQDPFYEQVLMPLIFEHAKINKTQPLPVIPDTDRKGDKWTRIEATLEPLNRNKQLIFNINEKESNDMQRCHTQFITAKATSKLLDAPDCIQGNVAKLKAKIQTLAPNSIKVYKRPSNDKNY